MNGTQQVPSAAPEVRVRSIDHDHKTFAHFFDRAEKQEREEWIVVAFALVC